MALLQIVCERAQADAHMLLQERLFAVLAMGMVGDDMLTLLAMGTVMGLSGHIAVDAQVFLVTRNPVWNAQ